MNGGCSALCFLCHPIENKYVHEVNCRESMYVRPVEAFDERAILLTALQSNIIWKVVDRENSGVGPSNEQIVDDYLAARDQTPAEIKTEVGTIFLSGGLAVPK